MSATEFPRPSDRPGLRSELQTPLELNASRVRHDLPLQRRRRGSISLDHPGKFIYIVVMGWYEPPVDGTVGGDEAREAQWERARGEGAERDLVGWGQDG